MPGAPLDARRQRALTRYYLDAGAGGLAVGVHTTQFAIREAGLYETVLRGAIETARDWPRDAPPPVMVAGACGRTAQAVAEARLARGLGYHAVLLSLAALKGASDDALIAHCEAVAREMPLIGFYLQPAVGGLDLGAAFWARFAALERVVAIKVAPFNRYRTLDVVRGVVAARAEDRVVLYTGNDDHIVLDLVTPFVAMRDGVPVTLRFRGGLLGHWSVWTKSAVELLERCKRAVAAAEAGRNGAVDAELLALDSRVSDCNSAFFDVANDFRRLHRRLPRGAAPPGAARGHLVPRSARGPGPGPGRGDRPGAEGACRPRPTTPSSPPVWSAGWHERAGPLPSAHPGVRSTEGRPQSRSTTHLPTLTVSAANS